MISLILAWLLLPDSLINVWAPLVCIEVVYVILGAIWRVDTKELPRLSYRAFRRIERMAPEKWEPHWLETGVAKYHTGIMGDPDVCIAMKTYAEAMVFKFVYKRQYEKRKRDMKVNQILEKCVDSWKADIAIYQEKAEAQAKKAIEENMRIQRRCSG